MVWADSLKGILIILVVLGHAIQHVLGEGCHNCHLWNMIYSFHMAAFMAVSGYLAFRGQRPKGVIFRRFRQLVVPFIIWSLILLLCGRRCTLDAVVNIFLYPDSGLWFLWVLFIINVLFVFGCWLSDRTGINQELVIAGEAIVLVLIMVLLNIRVFGFQFIAYYFLFYAIGYYLHKYQQKIVTKNPWVLALLFLCWCVLAWFWKMHGFPPGTITQYLYRFVTALLAVYVLMAVAPKVLDSTQAWNATLRNIGALSLGIYTVHIILLTVSSQAFCGLQLPEPIKIAALFAAALLASWLLVWLLNKWKITSVWLLGKL